MSIEEEQLWKKYFPRLQVAVNDRLRKSARLGMYADEIAASALRTYLRRVDCGLLDPLDDPDALWRLLKTIVIRKTNDRRKFEYAKKRGGVSGIVRESELAADDATSIDSSQGKPDRGLSLVELYDWFNVVFNSLDDDEEKDIVLLRLQGATTSEVANMLQLSERTVQRRLAEIFKKWQLFENKSEEQV